MVSPSGEEKVESFGKESGSGDKSPRRWSFPKSIFTATNT
jgi:hypothetical protein